MPLLCFDCYVLVAYDHYVDMTVFIFVGIDFLMAFSLHYMAFSLYETRDFEQAVADINHVDIKVTK